MGSRSRRRLDCGRRAAEDRAVLARAFEEARVLLAFDKDFGALAWKERLPAQCGAVLFRCAMPAPAVVGSALAAMVAQRDDWPGHFPVIEDGRVRMRPIDDGAEQDLSRRHPVVSFERHQELG